MQHSLNHMSQKSPVSTSPVSTLASRLPWLGLVALLSPFFALSANTQVLNCANVQVDPRNGKVTCADSPAVNNSTPVISPQPSGVPVPSPVGTDFSIPQPMPQQTNSERVLERRDYDELTTGMVLTAVIKQLGQPNRTLDRLQLSPDRLQTTYQWQFRNGDITLYFINDALIGKSSGLTYTESAIDPTTELAPNPSALANGSANNTPVTILPPLSLVNAASSEHVFNRLETGIDLGTAQSILGQLGTEQMKTQTAEGWAIVVYKWQTSQGSITAIFQNDRLISKSWCGACSL